MIEYQKATNLSKSLQQNKSKTITNRMMKKYVKKDIYLQKEDRKLLIS